MANPTNGTFTATGQSPPFAPVVATRDANCGEFNIVLTGTAVATVQLESSFDNGTTWCRQTAMTVNLGLWAYGGDAGVNFAESWSLSEAGVLFRLNCTAYTSGTLSYRLSQ